jgi:hypothetical protein
MAATVAILFLLWLAPLRLGAAEPAQSPAPAPTEDRVGFPRAYQKEFHILRTFNKEKEQKVVTVYGNTAAASITNAAQLPYPYGSIFVMETSSALKDAQGKPVPDEKGNLRKDRVLGLHVMRRQQNFGTAYGENRAGEWEYVEYRPDGSYLTPPQDSSKCATCHQKAGAQRDFVYRGRLPPTESK